MSGLELGAAVPAPGFFERPALQHALRAPGASPPGNEQPAPGEYARTIEAAAARNDAVALAYELGRLDATEAEELATGLVESALERLGHLPTAN